MEVSHHCWAHLDPATLRLSCVVIARTEQLPTAVCPDHRIDLGGWNLLAKSLNLSLEFEGSAIGAACARGSLVYRSWAFQSFGAVWFAFELLVRYFCEFISPSVHLPGCTAFRLQATLLEQLDVLPCVFHRLSENAAFRAPPKRTLSYL
ncbi:hypothetical protein L1887_63219 [Cichorium endivia]|nr:hypothetical protein L1887_63219 [Cichorium endivia]